MKHGDGLSFLDKVRLERHTDLFSRDYWHYFAKIDLSEGRSASGFGSADNETLAKKKAINELVERIAFWDHHCLHGTKTSNGFAAHDSLELASKKSKLELIERDVFIGTWLAARYPLWLSPCMLGEHAASFLESRIAMFLSHGFSLRVGISGIVDDVFVMTSVLTPSESSPYIFGSAVASAADTDALGAIKAVVSDQRRVATMISSRAMKSKVVFEAVDSGGLKKSSDHLEYYLDPARMPVMNGFMKGSQEVCQLPSLPIEISEIPLVYTPPWEVHVTRAESLEAQPYYVGETKPHCINRRRLAHILGRRPLNREAHPLA